MPNLWDRPPIPKRGDENDDITFSHVGRFMSEWEALEFELSRLYAFFAGTPDSVDLMQVYGTGSIFAERSRMLEQAARAKLKQVADSSQEE